MRNANTNAPDVSVRFYDNYAPALKQGEYTIDLTQQVKVDGDQRDIPPTLPPATQEFVIEGARFEPLLPGAVSQRFPQPGQGNYEDYLPQLVLRQPTLPWERSLDSQKLTDKGLAPELVSLTPWVALLVCTEDQLCQDPNSASPTRSTTISLAELTTSHPRQLNPYFSASPAQPAASCQVVELRTQAFNELLPSIEDLRYLAHTREVGLAHKAYVAGQRGVSGQGGVFSTVIANRFGVPPANGEKEQVNIVHLVSLEGFEDCLRLTEQPQVSTADFDSVRMVSLFSWTFTCRKTDTENFSTLMRELIKPPDAHLLLRLPTPAPAGPAEATEHAPAIGHRLAAGYVPLGYNVLNGDQTFAWYRGPLSAVPMADFLADAPLNGPQLAAPTTSAEAMLFEPTTGLFDQSYAVAFQVGRSLALASQRFADSLLNWRRQGHHTVDVLQEYFGNPVYAPLLQQAGLRSGANGLAGLTATNLRQLLVPGAMTTALQQYFTSPAVLALVAKISHEPLEAADATPLAPAEPPQPLGTAGPAGLLALMQRPELTPLLAEVLAPDPLLAAGPERAAAPVSDDYDLVVKWLADLSLLRDVPFHNLVAHPHLLPPDSIRFFYLDPTWMTALLAGALSIGQHTQRDTWLQQALAPTLLTHVRQEAPQNRDKLLGVADAGRTPEAEATAGFLLRSRSLTGWAGLEIKAYAAADAVNPMKPLRLEPVAEGVFLALYPSVPVRVTFTEPAEGLVFGVTNAGVALRYVPGVPGFTTEKLGQLIEGAKPLTPAEVKASYYRPQTLAEPAPALRLAGPQGLVQQLQTRLQDVQPGATSGCTLSPAAFAVQMVRVPEELELLTTPTPPQR